MNSRLQVSGQDLSFCGSMATWCMIGTRGRPPFVIAARHADEAWHREQTAQLRGKRKRTEQTDPSATGSVLLHVIWQTFASGTSGRAGGGDGTTTEMWKAASTQAELVHAQHIRRYLVRSMGVPPEIPNHRLTALSPQGSKMALRSVAQRDRVVSSLWSKMGRHPRSKWHGW